MPKFKLMGKKDLVGNGRAASTLFSSALGSAGGGDPRKNYTKPHPQAPLERTLKYRELWIVKMPICGVRIPVESSAREDTPRSRQTCAYGAIASRPRVDASAILAILENQLETPDSQQLRLRPLCYPHLAAPVPVGFEHPIRGAPE